MDVTLAIDYGDRRVGIAVSSGLFARPLAVLPHGRPESLVARILEVARREQASRLLVGLPLNADRSIGPQAEKAMRFAATLAAAAPWPVYLWDERDSSVAAQQTMIATGRGRRARKQELDSYAAAAFLQDYLDHGGQGATLVEPAAGET